MELQLQHQSKHDIIVFCYFPFCRVVILLAQLLLGPSGSYTGLDRCAPRTAEVGGLTPSQPSSRGIRGLASAARCCGEPRAGEAHADREWDAAPPPGPPDPTSPLGSHSSKAPCSLRALDGRWQKLPWDSESRVAERSRASLLPTPSSREADLLTLLSQVWVPAPGGPSPTSGPDPGPSPC